MSVTAATMLPIRRLLASGNNAAAMSKTTFVRCMTASPLAGRKSLYDVLGVAPDSEQAEIKKAFISQSKKMHPDMNPDDVHAANESFRELASAYQILGNPQSRESYDNERLNHRGDPRDFNHDDLGRDGEMPRQRMYKTPKPVYNSYGAHGPRQNERQNPYRHHVDVDLSHERMARAWEAYKVRWAKEEDAMMRLMEKKVEFRRHWDHHRGNNFASLPEEEKAKLRDDVRLFRIREESMKEEFRGACDKPLTDEEAEQMWKEDCPPRGGFDPSTFEERHRARNARMEETRARNAEMNEEVRQMERKVEEDGARDVREREQEVEVDKGRSTKNITEEYEKIWKNAETSSASGSTSTEKNSGYDPMFEELQKTGKAGGDFFKQGKQATEEQLKNIKKNWDDSSFFYDNSGSSSSGGGFVSHHYGVRSTTVAFIVILFIAMLYMDNNYKKDIYSTNIYLQELERLEKLDLEKKGKVEATVSDK